MTVGRKTKLRILSGYDVPAERRGQAALITLMRVFNRMTAQATQMVKTHGLSLPHFEVLLCLDVGEGLSQQDLVERMLLTKGNICVMMQKMEARGLIERQSDPLDQRFQRLYLTKAGRQLLAAVKPEHVGLMRSMLKGLSFTEQRTLHELLCRIDDTFDEIDS